MLSYVCGLRCLWRMLCQKVERQRTSTVLAKNRLHAEKLARIFKVDADGLLAELQECCARACLSNFAHSEYLIMCDSRRLVEPCVRLQVACCQR